MKNLLQNLPMHRKLLLLLFFPSVLLLWFASQSLLTQWQHYQNAAQVRAAIGDHLLLGQLVNALQVERGSSGIFISSKGARFSAEVNKARSGSDERLAALTGTQRAALSELIQALPGLRSQIDSFGLDATTAAAGYTRYINQLLQRNDEAVQTLTDLTLARQLGTLNDWIELIERAGRERAMVSLAFSQDQAEPALFSRIAQNQGAFLVFSNRLQQHSADAKALLQQADSSEYLALQPLVLQSASGQKFGQDAANWFSVASKRMALLIRHQQQLMQQIGDAAATQQATARASLLQAAVLLLLAVMVVAGFSLAIHRNIQQAMQQIRNLMQQLTGRDLTARSQYQG